MAGENPQTTLPPVPREPLIDSRGGMSSQWERWLQQIQRVLSFTGGVAWAIINKTSSRLDDIETRTHAMLQSILGWVSGADTVQNKHISNANGKKWEDHVDIVDGNPHGTDWDMIEGTTSEIPFNVATPGDTNSEGYARWNEADHCLEYVSGLGNIVQIGQEQWGIGVNKIGSTAVDGKCVYASGVQGNRLTFLYADARDGAKCSFVGVVTSPINNNQEGPITTFGLVRGLDTSGWAAGTKLYIAADATGTMTSTAPSAPNYRIWVATVVVSNPSVGEIFVSPRIDFADGITFHSLDILTQLTAATAVIGTSVNNTTFEADGTAVFNGAATVWKDVMFPMAPPKTTGAGNPTLVTYNGNLRGYSFAVNDVHDFDPQEMEHDSKVGSTATFHVHWLSRSNDGTDRAVKWELEYDLEPGTGALPVTVTTSIEVVIPAGSAVNTVHRTDISTFSITAIARLVGARIKRIASAGTAPSVDPVLRALHFHYELDTVGSRQITTK